MKQFQYNLLTNKQASGFSLIEMMVVVSIVMMAFIGVLTLADRMIIFRSMNEDSLVAVELANEGLELVRYVRNDNWLEFSDPTLTTRFDFDNNISVDSSNKQGDQVVFSIDPRVRTDYLQRGLYFALMLQANGITPSTDIDAKLKTAEAQLYMREDSAGNWSYIIEKGHTNNDQPSKFYRLITTIYNNNNTLTDFDDDYLYVVSKVYWRDRNKDYYYTVSTYLYDYDWYY